MLFDILKDMLQKAQFLFASVPYTVQITCCQTVLIFYSTSWEEEKGMGCEHLLRKPFSFPLFFIENVSVIQIKKTKQTPFWFFNYQNNKKFVFYINSISLSLFLLQALMACPMMDMQLYLVEDKPFNIACVCLFLSMSPASPELDIYCTESLSPNYVPFCLSNFL